MDYVNLLTEKQAAICVSGLFFGYSALACLGFVVCSCTP